MAEKRGYNIDDERPILDMTAEEFLAYVTEKSAATNNIRGSLSTRYSNDRGEKFLVYFATTEKGQKQIPVSAGNLFIKAAASADIAEAIFVIDAPMSSQCKSSIETLTGVRCQVFDDEELHLDPTEHIDNPPMIMLTEEEKEAKLRELRVAGEKGCPQMNASDPICKYYGWPVGSMIKIIRNNGASILTNMAINYRIVIP